MATNVQNLMKFAVLVIATIAISFSAKAQEWYIYGEYTWSAPHPVGTFYERHYQGETVDITGLEYNTIYVQNPAKTATLDGAYRNEGYQVYYCKWNGSSFDDEVLLYDYDLEVGDFFNDEDVHPMQVIEVSTVTDLNGVQRKKITFTFTGLEDVTEFWIEGVGSSRGFIHAGMYEPDHAGDGEMYHMLCYHVGNDVVYVNPEYNDCDLPYNVDENAESSIEVYPNPASDIIKILNSNNLNITGIEIIDMTGRIVLATGQTDDIDISNIHEGQYFVKLYGDSTIVRKLFIKK